MLDTTFPHAKPQMLYWNVQSEMDGEATVEITYFTSGISWSADYLCIANPAETELGLEGFVRVYNNSGEEYEDAQVRLVVGRINLVQKIAELARITPQQVDRAGGGRAWQVQGERRSGRRSRDGRGRGARRPPEQAGGAQAGRQGRAGRILHLHHRRHRDDPQRLVEADAEPRSGRGAASRSSTATARPNTATNWCGCTC